MDFLPLVRAASIVGKVPFTSTPFNVKLTKQTAGGSTSWVGENTLKPVSKLAFGSLTLPWAKASSIVVLTEELVRLSAPGSEQLMANTLRDEMAVFFDKELLGNGAAIAGVRPAGILNGITPVTGTGNLAADLGTLALANCSRRAT